MATYKVKRRILHNGEVYQPGSQIELTEKQAAQMRNGQIEKLKAQPKPQPVKPAAPAKPQTAPVIPTTGDDKGQPPAPPAS